MQYSPKLKVAMAEIEAILQKHDIAGFVCIHTPGFSEYMNHLATSYSAATVQPGSIKIVVKTEDVGVEKARQMATDTYNMILHISRCIQMHAPLYSETHKLLKAKWNPIEFDGGHTTHEEQNN